MGRSIYAPPSPNVYLAISFEAPLNNSFLLFVVLANGTYLGQIVSGLTFEHKRAISVVLCLSAVIVRAQLFAVKLSLASYLKPSFR